MTGSLSQSPVGLIALSSDQTVLCWIVIKLMQTGDTVKGQSSTVFAQKAKIVRT